VSGLGAAAPGAEGGGGGGYGGSPLLTPNSASPSLSSTGTNNCGGAPGRAGDLFGIRTSHNLDQSTADLSLSHRVVDDGNVLFPMFPPLEEIARQPTTSDTSSLPSTVGGGGGDEDKPKKKRRRRKKSDIGGEDAAANGLTGPKAPPSMDLPELNPHTPFMSPQLSTDLPLGSCYLVSNGWEG